eukprot:scaffold30933_cov101-Isochrysis_galbana.AAC.2
MERHALVYPGARAHSAARDPTRDQPKPGLATSCRTCVRKPRSLTSIFLRVIFGISVSMLYRPFPASSGMSCHGEMGLPSFMKVIL